MITCARCGGSNVQVSLPAWFNANNINELKDVDAEASPRDYFCEDCGDPCDVVVEERRDHGQ